MKNIKIIFWQVLFILPIFLFAQKQTYKEAMDAKLINVSRTQMTTNILYDRVYSFANLDQTTAATPTVDYFMQSWNELHNASYNPTFLNATAILDRTKISINNSQIPIGIINLRMNYFDFGTDTNPNLVYFNNLFENVTGRNPFAEKLICSVLPLVSAINKQSVVFEINQDFIATDNF